MKAKLAQGGLYVITDTGLTPGERLIPAVSAALRGGAGLLQYRDKSSDRQRRKQEAQALLSLCRDHGVPLIINDDIELTLQVGADGVHLGRTDVSPRMARAMLGPQAIIGISGYADPQAAITAEADYIAFGRLFNSKTKPEASKSSLDVLRHARPLTHKPLVGIGGIHAGNATQVLSAGANWLAVINAVFSAENIQTECQRLSGIIAQQI